MTEIEPANYNQFFRSWKLNASKQAYFSMFAVGLRIARQPTGARKRYRYIVSTNSARITVPEPFSLTGYRTLREAVTAIWIAQQERPPKPVPQGLTAMAPMKGDDMWRHYEYPGVETKLLYVSDQTVVLRTDPSYVEQHMDRKVFDAEYRRTPPHKVLCEPYVWCDNCGDIHPNVDQCGEENCKPANWRKVYVESYDKEETF